MLDINIENISDCIVVRLKGSLNCITCNNLLDRLLPLLKRNKKLIYNLSNLSSVDKLGHKSLLVGYNTILDNNGMVLVVGNNFKLEYLKETNNELSALEILNRYGG